MLTYHRRETEKQNGSRIETPPIFEYLGGNNVIPNFPNFFESIPSIPRIPGAPIPPPFAGNQFVQWAQFQKNSVAVWWRRRLISETYPGVRKHFKTSEDAVKIKRYFARLKIGNADLGVWLDLWFYLS